MFTSLAFVLVGLIIFGLGWASLPKPNLPSYKNMNDAERKAKEHTASKIAMVGILFIVVALLSYPLLNIYESKMKSIADSFFTCGTK